jgi:hypothetical protein
MRISIGLALAFALVGTAPAQAAELLRIPVRAGVELRAAVEPPAGGAAAYALLFAGGNGKIELDEGGRPQGLRGNFLIRARRHLAARGIGLVLVDAPSDEQGAMGLRNDRLSPQNAQDIGRVVVLIRRRFRRPVWLVGTSAGTLSVAVAMAQLAGAARPDGVVYTSSITRRTRNLPATVFDVNLGAYTGPALVIAHDGDACPATPPGNAPRLFAALAAAHPKRLQTFSGGLPPRSGPCQARSQHGFLGVETQVMNAIADFILRPAP